MARRMIFWGPPGCGKTTLAHIIVGHCKKPGTVTLLGAMKENPSFSMNSVLFSRWRVVMLEKLAVELMMKVLERALPEYV